MSATLDTAPTAPAVITTACRVCGEPIKLNAAKCSQCGTPTSPRQRESRGVGWSDFVLAWLSGILALSIGMPITFALSALLWNRGWTFGAFPIALMITALNVGLIGLPIGMTLWRWRDRVMDGEADHSMALREYWQIQFLCLLPFATIGLFIGALWVIAVYLSY